MRNQNNMWHWILSPDSVKLNRPWSHVLLFPARSPNTAISVRSISKKLDEVSALLSAMMYTHSNYVALDDDFAALCSILILGQRTAISDRYVCRFFEVIHVYRNHRCPDTLSCAPLNTVHNKFVFLALDVALVVVVVSDLENKMKDCRCSCFLDLVWLASIPTKQINVRYMTFAPFLDANVLQEGECLAPSL
ncbi:hypothetical protein EK21DRAFT_88263 [Setomelanomma holmii]|uniref:Uncharacterized protein n=1 Tax=Setomelanomma holmii TaxID=210430 RepID=A0A9P4HBN7_9PLEO|nr:hypothetical protein EK21DRAFT_88263 [Setomelanomma holmii]